jgi:oligopeptide transport system ATP-binding protein
MSEPLLRVWNLTKQFPITGGLLGRQTGSVHAIDGVDFTIDPAETLGLVGESGCGKSTTGRCVLRLIEPTSGEIYFEGKNVRSLEADALRVLRRDIQIIFQDPYASLNPRMNVSAIVGEALIIHKLTKTRRQFEERVVHLLETVGLQADHMGRYPNEFSGRRLMCRSRPRSSICWKICSRNSDWLISSLPMTCRSSSTSAGASP